MHVSGMYEVYMYVCVAFIYDLYLYECSVHIFIKYLRLYAHRVYG